MKKRIMKGITKMEREKAMGFMFGRTVSFTKDIFAMI